MALGLSPAPVASQSIDLAEALDQPAWSFVLGGEGAWSGQGDTTHDASDAAQNGATGDNEFASLSSTVTFPADGTISFWWKVSSEEHFDFLRFFIDGKPQAEVSGAVDWRQATFLVGSGEHTLAWEYRKDSCCTDGDDTAWVDQVVYAEGGALPPARLNVVAVGKADGMPIAVDVTVNPWGLTGERGGTTPCTLSYNMPSWVNVQAPATAGAAYFSGWKGCAQVYDTTSCMVVMDQDRTVTLLYASDPPRTVTVLSTNPASGIPIYASSDIGGSGSEGTTPFARAYAAGAMVSLSAPLREGDYYFQSWTGCEDVDGPRCWVTASADLEVTANYAAQPVTRSLSVVSTNPASGVGMLMSTMVAPGVMDLTKATTPFTRRFQRYGSTRLIAPVRSGGHFFGSWTGCTSTGLDSVEEETWCYVEIDADMRVTANYRAKPYTLTVRSSGAAAAAGIRVSPSDASGAGDGTAPFVRGYAGTEVHLTAAPAAGGSFFVSWTGCSEKSAGADCYHEMVGDHTVTANYAAAPSVSLADAVDQPGWLFTSGPEGAGWYGVPGSSRDGADSAWGTAFGQVSWLETMRTIPAGGGYLLFWWRCELVAGSGDKVRFLVDGVERAATDREANRGWLQRAFPVPEGEHTFRWELDNTSGASWGRVMVDDVSFTTTEPIIDMEVLVDPWEADAPIGLSPPDVNGNAGGWYWLTRSYPCGTELSLTVPLLTENAGFLRWMECDSTTGSRGEQCLLRASGGEIVARYNRAETVGLGESLDQPLWDFTAGGDAPFVGRSDEIHDADDAATSGWIEDGQRSFFEVTRAFSKGSIRSWWKTRADRKRQFLSFYVDDVKIPKASITGEVDWQEVVFPLAAGEHRLRWEFSSVAARYSFNNRPDAAGFVDEIIFTPAGLTAPAWVTATDNKYSSKIGVAWADAVGKAGFRIYRSREASRGYSPIGATGAAVRSFDDQAVGCGESWYYRVRSTNADGDSVFSPPNEGSTSVCPPPPPVWLNADDGVQKFQVEVRWENVAGATGYRLYRSLGSEGPPVLVATLGPAAAADSEVHYVDRPGCSSPVQQYSYKVVAFNAGGDSGDSPEDIGYAQTCGLGVDAPALEADWPQGSAQTIRWSGVVDTGKVRIDLYKGTVFKGTIALAAPNSGAFVWTVPALLATGSDYRVKVSWTGNPAINDFSDSFSVSATTGPIVVTPEATVAQGEVQTIAWTGVPTAGKVKLLLYKNNVLRSTIAASAPNTGTYDWVVPGTLATAADYTVQVVWLSNLAVKGTSDPFAVTATAGPIVVTPSAASVAQGEVQTITWTGVPETGNVKLLLYKNNVLRSTIAASTPNHGSYEWVVTGTLTAATDYTVEVVWLSNLSVKGRSDSFAVTATAGPVVVTAGVPSVAQGEVQSITWTGLPATGNVKLLLCKAGVLKATIVASTKNLGSYDWVVPGTLAAADDYTVEVVWLSNQSVKGTSDPFAVTATAGPLTVTPSPTVAQGEVQTISWKGMPATGNVKLLLYKAGVLRSTIVASTKNLGTYDWAVPASLATGADYTVQVVWLSNLTVKGTSDPFAVTATAGPIMVGLPVGGETWIQGSTEAVAWSGIPATGNVRIDLYKGTVLYRTLLASTPNVGAAEIAVPAVPVPTDCRVKVTWLSRSAIGGWSGTITIE
jgi:hypothetical protein